MTATVNNALSDDLFKVYLLKIIAEDKNFAKQLKIVLHPKKSQPIALSKTAIPFSEMPYWKMRPHAQPRDPKPFAIKKETVLLLQTEWADAPPVEVLLQNLD
jgi:hypothetical protein